MEEVHPPRAVALERGEVLVGLVVDKSDQPVIQRFLGKDGADTGLKSFEGCSCGFLWSGESPAGDVGEYGLDVGAVGEL